MAKVLVTGSAGFIGMHTSLQLLEEGYEVVGLDNVNEYYDVNLKYARLKLLGVDKSQIQFGKILSGKSNFKFIQLNVEDKKPMMDLYASEKFDYVIHLAAQAGVRYSLENPQAYIDSNVTGFLNILECCRAYPVKHLLYASSSSVYGLNVNVPFKESYPTEHPVSLYAATKKANEMMAHSYAHLFQIPSTGLRFFTVYGPWGRPDMALFMFTKNILSGKPINVFNNGDMFRDFTYVQDIVNGVTRILKNPPKVEVVNDKKDLPSDVSSTCYSIFNIGNNKPVNLKEFVVEIEKKLGKEAIMNYMPMQPGDVQLTYANTDKLQKEVTYLPSVGIKEGINNFIDWYKDYFKV